MEIERGVMVVEVVVEEEGIWVIFDFAGIHGGRRRREKELKWCLGVWVFVGEGEWG